uniref:FolC bifunctional protein n=1 Tax=mine drainage metagenome TaxID=410659 RepID=E6PYI2_9ZZZZ
MAQILFPLFDTVVLTPVPSPRTTEMSTLRAAAERTGTTSVVASDTYHALEIARSRAGITGRIIVSGSVYLVGEARHLVLEAKRRGQTS